MTYTPPPGIVTCWRAFRICAILAFLAFGCSPAGRRSAASTATAVNSSVIEAQDRQIRSAIFLTLIPVVVAFSFFVFVVYRSRREAQIKHQEMELRLNMSELEMKALRAQMNPHFIFNCLNSIHHFMRANDVGRAGDYLLKFSQLIRHVLETSSFRMIPLAEDLEALRAYLELEQLRMQGAFSFRIDTDAIGDCQRVYVPSMMVQPFAENAIWHGLRQRGAGGFIDIRLSLGERLLNCVLEDNGERHKTAGSHVMPGIKKTSMGMSLINERIAAVNRMYNANAGFRIEDRSTDPTSGHGTRIILTLPYEQE